MPEVHGRIPVGMRPPDVEYVDRLVVVVEADGLVEGDLRQSLLGVGLLGHVAGEHVLLRQHARAAVLLRHDGGPQAAEVLVSVRVVVVPVGVDDVFHRVVGQLCDGGHDPVRQRGELVVDDQGPVVPDGHSDIAPASL